MNPGRLMGVAAGLLLLSALPAPAATLSGTIEIDAAIAIEKGVPASTQITAEGEISVSDQSGQHSVYDTAAVKWSGTSASVQLVLPYLWQVDSPQQTMSVTLYVSTATRGLPTSSTTAVIVLPANGKTTAVPLPAVI